MSETKRPISHLTDQQKHGKPFPWKQECLWCDHLYDTDLSDATNPKNFCSQKCEKEYVYTE